MPADGVDGVDGVAGVDGALDLQSPRRVHIVGIGGAGMSAIAVVLKAMGHSVTGSDIKDSPVAARLRSQGIAVAVGHAPDHVGPADAVTFSPAVPPDNPEILAAAAAGVRVVPRSGVLAAICATRRCVAVAGTKGKTTTASMLSLILIEAGLRPSFLIGADVNEVGTNAVWDEGEWLVVEADESFGTFQHIHPDLVLLTNVEADHLDHYGTVERLRAAFDAFVAGATIGAVVSADDVQSAVIGQAHGAASVGTDPDATFSLREVELQRSATSFHLVGPRDGATSGALRPSEDTVTLGRVTLGVPGLHNARNAALAIAAALRLGVPFATAAAALARFAGVSRRFEFRGESGGVTFVDDYAHLPFAVEAVLATARAGGWSRVLAVFQPHRFSRTAELAQEFGSAFIDADLLVVTDVYGAGEAPVPGISGQLIVDAVRARDPRLPVVYAPGWDELRQVVTALLRPGDLCLTLGAGDLTTLPDQLLESPGW
jgi:UDP-N-acetylmuramate--alanine ligase